ncbi:MAG: peptidoglycan-binding protein, partial [Rivularia sp. (in: cyanobacteria)]
VGVSDGPLSDAQTKKAIREFQRGYKIGVDGIAGSQTQNLAADIVKSLKYNLNLVAKPNPKLPLNQYYGPRTQEVVKEYQVELEVEQTGIADLAFRQELNQQAKQNPQQPEPTATPEATPEATPSPTATPEVTPTPVIPGSSPIPTLTPEPTPTPTVTPPVTPSPTATPEVTPTPVIPDSSPTPVIPESSPTPTESPDSEDEEATPTPTPRSSP